jgi:hypothetical protein
MDISIEDLQYAAGFFDGDGCIQLEEKSNQKNTFVVNVRITNTNREVLDWFKARFNGHIGIQPPNRNVKTNKKCWYWKCESRIANTFLKTVIPFLVLKREQAQIAIDFQSRVKRGANRLTHEEIEIRRGMSTKICELKDTQHLIPYTEKLDLRYLAGFIDGEGNVCIYDVPGPHYELSMRVTNSNESVVRLLKNSFGGSVCKKEDGRDGPCFDWQIQGDSAAILLEDVLQCLICKRPHAVLAIEFQRAKEKLKKSEEVLRNHGPFFRSYQSKIADLNQGSEGVPFGTPS